MRETSAGAVVQRLVGPVVLLAAWEGSVHLGLLPDYLVAPSLIAAALYELAASGELWGHFAASLFRAFTGFAVGTLCGVTVGLAAGTSRPVHDFFEPLVALFYPIPKIAFLPIIILWLGLGHSSKIAIISISVFFPTFIAAFYAVRSIDRVLLWSARNMGASRRRIFLRVILPASLPQVFSGLRVALALSFIVLFAAELMGARNGLGFLIVVGEDDVRFDIMFAGIVTIALVGFACDRVLLRVRRRVLRGQIIGKEETLA